MGCASSSSVVLARDVELIPQPKPVVAFSSFRRHYCVVPELLVLEARRESGVFNRDITTFRDANDSARFCVKRSVFSRRRTLDDGSTSAPIANYKAPYCFHPRKVRVRDRDAFEGREVLRIRATFGRGARSVARVKFSDAVTGERCELGFVGDWGARDGHIWLDRRRCGVREPVATIRPPIEGAAYCGVGYHVAVARNMDAALIVLLCSVLSTKQRRAERMEEYDAWKRGGREPAKEAA